MLAERVMNPEPVTASIDEVAGEVLARMRSLGLRMLPVLDQSEIVVGVISTFSIMQHIMPDYIASGDLGQISYAPDMDILNRRYRANIEKELAELMDDKPLLVKKDDSILAVAAAMISFGRHELALVVDEQKRLVGVISAGDILNHLKQVNAHESGAV